MAKRSDPPRSGAKDSDHPDKSEQRRQRTPTPVENAEADKEDRISQREELPLRREGDDAKSVDGQHNRPEKGN